MLRHAQVSGSQENEGTGDKMCESWIDKLVGPVGCKVGRGQFQLKDQEKLREKGTV